MRKRMMAMVLTVLFLLPVLTLTASADSGPKPSTVITVRGGGGECMIFTLLSRAEQWGPYTAIGPGEEPSDYMVDDALQEEAWYAFRDYADSDGFFFLGEVFEGGVRWTYWPPEEFKVAVYYPGYDVLWVSEDSYTRYAFRSDYELTLPAVGAGGQSGTLAMDLEKESGLLVEILGLLQRAALTIVVELLLSRAFGFTSPRQQKIVLRTNLVTQLILHGLLWGWYYFSGPLAALLGLAAAELVVLIVELIVYLRLLREGRGVMWTTLYTICANLASVVLGFVLLV